MRPRSSIGRLSSLHHHCCRLERPLRPHALLRLVISKEASTLCLPQLQAYKPIPLPDQLQELSLMLPLRLWLLSVTRRSKIVCKAWMLL